VEPGGNLESCPLKDRPVEKFDRHAEWSSLFDFRRWRSEQYRKKELIGRHRQEEWVAALGKKATSVAQSAKLYGGKEVFGCSKDVQEKRASSRLVFDQVCFVAAMEMLYCSEYLYHPVVLSIRLRFQFFDPPLTFNSASWRETCSIKLSRLLLESGAPSARGPW